MDAKHDPLTLIQALAVDDVLDRLHELKKEERQLHTLLRSLRCRGREDRCREGQTTRQREGGPNAR
jgi:hypothetical protein